MKAMRHNSCFDPGVRNTSSALVTFSFNSLEIHFYAGFLSSIKSNCFGLTLEGRSRLRQDGTMSVSRGRQGGVAVATLDFHT